MFWRDCWGSRWSIPAALPSSQVLEVMREKKIIWKFQLKNHCYDAHRLPKGNTLIATNLNVIEVTRNGKTVWVLNGIGSSYGIQPLSNGNILVGEFSHKRISEVTREKKIVRTYSVTNPFDIFRLPNGNTLITTSSRFLEVTLGKTVIWTRSGNSYGRARK
ncbi:MAG: hypothetical protein IID45_14550 [Planctomycetes bacterium]|nr:hypothetical protein [Planctomycetota bacterium]